MTDPNQNITICVEMSDTSATDWKLYINDGKKILRDILGRNPKNIHWIPNPEIVRLHRAGPAVTSESVQVPVQAAPRTDSQEVPEVPSTDVVKLPTIEMPALQIQDLVTKTQVSQASSAVTTVEVPPAPRMTPISTSAVSLTDSIMVSPELANAGAVTLTPEQLAQLSKPAKWVYVVGGAMAAAIVVLLAVAVHLALRQHEAAEQAAEVQRVAVPAQVPQTPTPVNVKADDDDLSPITPVRATAKKSATSKGDEQGFDMPERNNLSGRTEL